MNTEAWLHWRLEGIGSSDAPIIMGVSPWKTPLELWREKTRKLIDKSGDNFATRRGNDLEPKARAQFELIAEMDFAPKLAEHSEYKFLRASLDGYNDETNTILEIKCPGKDDHALAMNGKIPDKYWPQLQHQLMVTGATKAYYYSFDGKSGSHVVVYPDMAYIKKLLDAELAFWDKVQKKIEPELSDKDEKLCFEEEAIELAGELAEALKQIDKLTKRSDVIKSILKEKVSHPIMRFGSVRAYKIVRQGNIDYNAIDGVDFEKYRKAPIEYISFKVVENKN